MEREGADSATRRALKTAGALGSETRIVTTEEGAATKYPLGTSIYLSGFGRAMPATVRYLPFGAQDFLHTSR